MSGESVSKMEDEKFDKFPQNLIKQKNPSYC